MDTDQPHDQTAATPPPPGGTSEEMPDGMSEEQMAMLMEQLRAAPAAELLADVFSSLLSTAQVKLGRRDARLFIDLAAQTLDHARPHLPADLTGQVDAALGQLRMAQVTAEQQVAEQGEPEPNDLERLPTPPPSAAPPSSAAPPPAASRLWVPGQ